ncbi:MAG TPA: class I SAM-dependent methyltransferase [Bryobacteraceae bacterium]|nr:class I SAM-dependent methyltransferase [Bryobacteraceae bacterium]
MTSPDPSPILDLIQAFRRSKVMFTAVSLGIFDKLQSNPANAAELATSLQCNPDALERLLDSCIALGFLSRSDGKYTNTEISSAYLVSNSPNTLAGYVMHSDLSLYPLWANLEDAVREGTNRWEQTFGSGKGLFDHFFRNEESRRSFLNGMHGFGCLSSPSVVRAFDLGFFRRVADLGGATGHLLIAACEAYPHLTGVVFDLPAVKPFAEEHIAASPAAGRIQFLSGDFFKDDLPPADLYFLARIVHDWSEEKIALLLRRIFAALPSGGGLLIAESLLDEDHSGPLPALMQHLNMLICTEGKERSCSEYKLLLESVGFRSVECRRTGTFLDAVLARKP